MAKKRWDRKFSDIDYFWDKLILCILQELSTTSYRDRVMRYDGINDDPIEEGYVFIKKHLLEIPNDSIINNYMSVFSKKTNYETCSKKIDKEAKKEIFLKSQEMIRRYSSFFQNFLYIPIPLCLLVVLYSFVTLSKLSMSGKNLFYGRVLFFDLAMGFLFVLLLLLFFLSIYVLKKGKTSFGTLNHKIRTYCYSHWAEEEIERLLDLYPLIKNKMKQKKERQEKLKVFDTLKNEEKIRLLNSMNFSEREDFYLSKTRDERRTIFILVYSELDEYFFEVCKELGYIDEEDHLIRKNQKDFITLLGSLKKETDNDYPLLYVHFKPECEYEKFRKKFCEHPKKADILVKNYEKMLLRIKTNTINKTNK